MLDLQKKTFQCFLSPITSLLLQCTTSFFLINVAVKNKGEQILNKWVLIYQKFYFAGQT